MVQRPPSRADAHIASEKLSYKFQRLREQIRAAIVRGEFTGQLPGERELGRRFDANAKTINKALCDLSSEGLLVRHIGRGTFVAASNDSSSPALRARACLALLPESLAGYRDELTALLDAALGEKGMALELVPVARLTDGQVPVSGWPTLRRRATAALISYPFDPLSGGRGLFNDDCISEGLRRQVPIVVLGALSGSAKVCAVAPDFSDAGFRLTDQLLQAGCGSVAVLTSTEGREANMIVAGAQAAGFRRESSVSTAVLRDGMAPSACLNGTLAAFSDRSRPSRERSPVGIVCVGSAVLKAVADDEDLQSHIRNHAVLPTCIVEPGDRTPATLGMTSYEIDLKQIAGWAARLIADARPGQRPQEVLIPGALKVRLARESAGALSPGILKSEAVI